MLDLRSRQVEVHLGHGDMGYGIPFRPGTFDGIIRYSNCFSNMTNGTVVEC